MVAQFMPAIIDCMSVCFEVNGPMAKADYYII